jgi:GDPmannose 4,6-dehydratase
VGLKPDDYLETSSSLIRPSKTSPLKGDTSKARKAFGFEPKIRFKQLVKLMVEADLEKENGR